MTYQPFSSKELYMMNGGRTLYIYKDGFGDVYNPGPGDEQTWEKELVGQLLVNLDTETNEVCLTHAIENLAWHNYPGLEALLLQKMQQATINRKIVFATCLWKLYKNKHSFRVLEENLQQHRNECLDEVFTALHDFKDNTHAIRFLVSSIESNDDVLIAKSQVTLTMWAYTGLSSLRNGDLLQMLRPENKKADTFKAAVGQLKKILACS